MSEEKEELKNDQHQDPQEETTDAVDSTIEENKEEASLKSYPLHEKLVLLAIMKANGSSTGEIYSSYKNLCKVVGKDGLTQRRVTQMLSEIELSGITLLKFISLVIPSPLHFEQAPFGELNEKVLGYKMEMELANLRDLLLKQNN